MSLLASSRSAVRHRPLLPQELWVSCFHTSNVSSSPSSRSLRDSKRGGPKKPTSSTSPSRRRLVKDLTPRSSSKHSSGRLVVAPVREPLTRDSAPHTEVRDKWKEYAERKEVAREIVTRKRERQELRQERRPGRWQTEAPRAPFVPPKDKPYKERTHAVHDSDLPNYDQPWRTAKYRIEKQRHREENFGVKEEMVTSAPPAPAEGTRKPQIFNPLSDEFDVSARAVSTRELPTQFTSPPLMEGLLTSVLGVLGPNARPTPIQALSLKHLFKRPLSEPHTTQKSDGDESPSTESEEQWQQALLASETGSGKSMAYLLPMLQDLKLSELRADPSQSVQSTGSRLPLNPRALVLAPTHELSRQLSGFAKALLHGIKLRVMCASQANLPSVSRRNVTASKMAKDFDTLVDSDGDGDSATLGLEAMDVKKAGHPVDVVVGTPAKILEMVKGRGWNYEQLKVEDTWDVDEHGKRVKPRKVTVGKPEMGLERVQWVIIDEADVLFDPDFQEDTKVILSAISEARGHKPEDLASRATADPSMPVPLNYPFNFVLSTATIPSALAWYLDTYHPSLIRLASPKLHHLPSTLKTEYSSWTGGNRNADIERRLRRVWHEDMLSGPGRRSKILVFCNKSTKVEDLGRYLKEKGIANVALTSTSDARKRGSNHHLDGFLRQRERSAVASDSKSNSTELSAETAESLPDVTSDDISEHPHVMITTSLLSRGLDFAPEIKHVFIVDEPRNMVDFLHRAGRSGRAGEQGKVVVFGKTKGRGSSKAKDMRKKVGALLA